jgi:Cation transport ATPase
MTDPPSAHWTAFIFMMANLVVNVSLSLGYNTITIPLAMMGWINPLLAAAAMAGSSVTVVLNSLRQKRQFSA